MHSFTLSPLRLFTAALISGFLVCPVTAADSPLIEQIQGELPIIISAPHGGSREVPGAKVREGSGLEKKPGGFVTARDGGTEELAQALVAAIERQFGQKPYAVINRAHRRHLDPNRPANEAYEDPAAQKVYETYHEALDRYCREVQKKHSAGLLLDLHGQGSRRDTVFRGTQNGLTVKRLRERFGEEAHQGEQSFFGLLKQRGITVYPDPLDGKEQAGFLGGYIVKNYGSHDRYGIDAIQLEWGGLYRLATNREPVAASLADAVAAYATQYLQIKLPAPLGPPTIFKPAPGTEKPQREVLSVWPERAPGETTAQRGELLPPMPGENPPSTRIHRITAPTLTYFPAANPTGSAVVICPGGGFARVVVDKEGAEIAEWLNGIGIAAFVLQYRTKTAQPDDPGWARPLQDLQRSLAVIRAQADQYQLKPEQLGVVGFSAGGQLAGRALLQGTTRTYPVQDAADEQSPRPNFGLLIYPWNLHREGTGELAEGLTVPADCPPTFLVHTDDDRVTALSSTAFYLALKRRGVPAELHIFAQGGHGYGLRPVAGSRVHTWPQLAAHWLRSQGWAQPAEDALQGLGQSPQ